VVSSDRHTVKPWLAAHAGFSPAVVDLAGDGYPLVGGRVDAVDGRATGVMVYKRRQHVIDVFVSPSPDPRTRAPELEGDSLGFHVIQWQANGFAFVAVSDIAPDDLMSFVNRLSTAAGG